VYKDAAVAVVFTWEKQ